MTDTIDRLIDDMPGDMIWCGDFPEDFWLERAKRMYVRGDLSLRKLESWVEAITRQFQR